MTTDKTIEATDVIMKEANNAEALNEKKPMSKNALKKLAKGKVWMPLCVEHIIAFLCLALNSVLFMCYIFFAKRKYSYS